MNIGGKEYKPLSIGETIRRGDVFVDDGVVYHMERGMLFGLPCVGVQVTKSGVWFMPVEEKHEDKNKVKSEGSSLEGFH